MRLSSFMASLLVIAALDAQAATFTVTRADDPLPGECAPGDCSLREAFEAAGSNDPFDVRDDIVVPAGTYALVRGTLGAIFQPLRVQGAGSGVTRIVDEDDAAMLIESASDDVELVGLGLASGGSAVYTRPGSSMRLDDVVVENGITTFSGTVEVHQSEVRRILYCQDAEVLIEDSTIFNLYMMPSSDTAAVTLRRTQVDGMLYPESPLPSRVVMHLGSLAVENSTLADTELILLGNGAMADVRDSTITRSSASLDNPASTLRLHRVHYVDNVGPIRTEGAASVTIEDSLFENNLVRALYAAGGADWTVNGSTFVGNRVDGNAGGAIVLEDDTTLRVRNSTFSANSFTVAAAADGARGGAIGYRNGAGAHLILIHVTIVPPAVVPVGIVGTAIGGHGGGTTVDVSNTIVRGSCGMNAGVLQNHAGNIESPGHSCGFDTESNLVDVAAGDLALGALGDHGGSTPTYLPGVDSFAIDHGSVPQCLPADQRGCARPGGARCDVGAVEADGIDTLFANGFDL